MATAAPALMARKHPILVRPFALTGLLLGLTGSTLGAVLLLRIQLSLGPVSPLWKQVHGQLQVFGFIVPLVLGFGTYLVPRITAGNPVRGSLAMPALGALAAAAGLTLAAPFSSAPALRYAVALLVAGGSLAGALCLHAPISARRREGGRRGYELLLEASVLFLALGGLADALAWWRAASEPDGDLLPGLASAAWRLSLEGFAVGMALAVSARMFSGFLGTPPPISVARGSRATDLRARVFGAAAWVWAGSVTLGGAGAAFGSPPLERWAEIAFAAGVVPLCFQLGLASSKSGPAIDRERDPIFPLGARTAYALLAAGALVGAAAAAGDLLDLRVHSLWFDARRHLINIGFLLTLIATMAGRLAPGFAGRPLALPWLRTAALAGFAASALCRALEGIAGQWGPEALFSISALSGPLAALSLLSLAAALAATLRAGSAQA